MDNGKSQVKIGIVIQSIEIITLGIKDVSLSSVLIVISKFLISMKNKDKEIKRLIGRIFSAIGEKYTFVIYILHLLIIYISSTLIGKLGLVGTKQLIVSWALPLITCIVSTIVSVVYVQCKNISLKLFGKK